MTASLAVAPDTEVRWHVVKDALEGWRDDDPDALPRCSVNPEHVIRNGDHYAISGIKFACLPCAELPAPKPAEERPRKPAPIPSRAAPKPKAEQQPKPPEPPTPPVVSTTATLTPAFTSRFSLGPSHPDYGKPFDAPTPGPHSPGRPKLPTEQRTCARDGCLETFEVRPRSPKRYHSQSCSAQATWATKRGRRPSREERTRICAGCGGEFVVDRLASTQRSCNTACVDRSPRVGESARCALCGGPFQPTKRLPKHCSWACEIRQAALPAEHGETCPCLRCATERAGIGSHVIKTPPAEARRERA